MTHKYYILYIYHILLVSILYSSEDFFIFSQYSYVFCYNLSLKVLR